MIEKRRVSVDFWGTLVKSSPDFKEEKIKLVKKFYPHCSLTQIDWAFAETKASLDKIIERTGWQPTLQNIWETFHSFLDEPNPMARSFVGLINQYGELALQNPPIVKKYVKEGLDFYVN